MDIQLRVYELQIGAKDVESTIASTGIDEARRVTWGTPVLRKAKDGVWGHIEIAYERDYGDYGGTAVVDCWLYEMTEGTYAFVFFHTENDGEREMAIKANRMQWIPRSFRAPNK